MLAIVTSKLGLMAMASVLVLGVIGVQTLRLNHAKSEITAMKAQEKAAEAAEKVREANAAVISQTASAGIVAAQEKTRTVTRTLVQKVTQYVSASADADCVVRSGVVQFLDAAAQVPSASSGPIQAPSGLPISAVAANVATNYGTAENWRIEAQGWRDWYVKQREVWNGK